MWGNSVWQLVSHSDLMTKFVLLVLFLMSVFCWGIFLYKIILFSIKRRQMNQAFRHLENIQTFEELHAIIVALSHTLPGYFLKRNLSVIKSCLERHPERAKLTEKEFDLVQNNMDQVIDTILHTQESYLPFLFSCASVSTLLGLFGTVWGLIHAFIRISEKQTADIATVAPGIAEALITTLAGLMVAIPTFLMYHYLNTQVRQLEHQLIRLSDKFDHLIQRMFVLD